MSLLGSESQLVGWYPGYMLRLLGAPLAVVILLTWTFHAST
jgi:hypothetical protein